MKFLALVALAAPALAAAAAAKPQVLASAREPLPLPRPRMHLLTSRQNALPNLVPSEQFLPLNQAQSPSVRHISPSESKLLVLVNLDIAI